MIVAGFGFRAGATTASLRAALAATGGGQDITHLATPADKAPALAELAAQLALPLIPIAADRLASLPTITRSPASLAARGAGSVAEACALAGVGEGARLRAARSLSPDRMATCAIAQGVSS